MHQQHIPQQPVTLTPNHRHAAVKPCMKTSTTTRLEVITQPGGEKLKSPEVANGQQAHEPPLQLQHLGEGESSSPRRQRTIADIAQPRVEGLRINSNLNEGDVLRQTVLDRMVWTQ